VVSGERASNCYILTLKSLPATFIVDEKLLFWKNRFYLQMQFFGGQFHAWYVVVFLAWGVNMV